MSGSTDEQVDARDEQIRAEVAAAPPLTDTQVAHLRDLFTRKP